MPPLEGQQEAVESQTAEVVAPGESHTPPAPPADSEAPSTMADAIDRGLMGEDGGEGAEGPPESDALPPAETGAADEQGAPTATDEEKGKGEGEVEEDITAVPEGLSERGKERFTKLSAGYKELQAQHQELEQRHTGLVKTIRDTGASTQEFAHLLDYARLVHSRNPRDLSAALETLDRERAAIARALGVDVPGVDVLADHPDLTQRVNNMELSREDAIELVRARNAQRQQTSQQETQQAQQHWKGRVHAGATRIGMFEQQMRAQDPNADAKFKMLEPLMQSIARSVPPEQWAETMQQQYQALAHIAAPEQPADRSKQPISGGTRSATPSATNAKSMSEAIDVGLGYGGT